MWLFFFYRLIYLEGFIFIEKWRLGFVGIILGIEIKIIRVVGWLFVDYSVFVISCLLFLVLEKVGYLWEINIY